MEDAANSNSEANNTLEALSLERSRLLAQLAALDKAELETQTEVASLQFTLVMLMALTKRNARANSENQGHQATLQGM